MVIVQFDVLWESLSAREHLHVFGSLKGLSGADIRHVSFDRKSVLSFFLCLLLPANRFSVAVASGNC